MLIELLRRLKYGDVDARHTSREYVSLSHLNQNKKLSFSFFGKKKKKIFERKIFKSLALCRETSLVFLEAASSPRER